jgi:HD-GYP domain-containing protein (c-di-GMP phosphodiesterase class II)
LESSKRKSLENEITSFKNYEFLKLYADIKYYSKETLYQYRDIESYNKWIIGIENLNNEYNSKLLKEYTKIAKEIGEITIALKEIEKEKISLKKNIINVINQSKELGVFIENDIKENTTKFINFVYSTIVFLILFILIFISVLGFKVYKNVGLSVDEIEEKVKEGIEEIKNLNNEIESTQKEVVFTMGAIGESRSKETGNHVKRVAEYSKLFALYYGLSKEEAELLKQASPMHDIGKVAIPDAILNKPGRFDENEREIMNTHAMLGYEMLKHSKRPILKAAAIVAKEHHEKWDGTGYPNGIKGENIHIYGRITALADVFDALGSDRVYKKAWDDERIFSLFKEERGKHFDPKLVDIFFENLDEFKKIREKLKDVIN